MSSSTSTPSVHSDRCFNPFGNPAHVGNDLRKLSQAMRAHFPNVSEKTRICTTCRKRGGTEFSKEFQGNTDCTEVEDVDVSETRKVKRKRISREDQLEELLLGLKQKLTSLPENDPLRVSILTIAPDCWSVRDIVSEFGVSHRMAQASKVLKREQGVLATPQPKRGKMLSERTIAVVTEFYKSDEYSRIMPNKKDVVSVIINGEKEHRQKRFLLCDIKVLHAKFKEHHPDFQIGLSKFAELRPQWCILAGARGTHSVCVCTFHQNFKAMFDAAQLSMLTKDSEQPLQNYIDCIEYALCRNVNPACYLGDCKSCPKIERFKTYITNILNTQEITELIFSTWEKVDRCTLQKHCRSSDNFVTEFSNALESLLPHHFISKNQSRFIKECKDTLKEDEVLLQCDFSENYGYIAQDAAQAFHYNNNQCTLHTVIFYYKSEKELKHQSIILLSDFTTHDAVAVYIMMQKVNPIIKKICPNVKKIIYVSDGARQHYKNKYHMINFVHHRKDFNLEAEWHFHATAHGKCACDGIGAVFKKEATRASLQAKSTESILNVESLIKWAKIKFNSIIFFEYSKYDHARIQRLLAKRFSLAPSVAKISQGHAFIVVNDGELQIMRYSNAPIPLASIRYEM